MSTITFTDDFDPEHAYAIVSLTERGDYGSYLYWSNDYGWVAPEEADLFTHAEIDTLRLPQHGAWVPMNWQPDAD